jgi:hypothetical protein
MNGRRRRWTRSSSALPTQQRWRTESQPPTFRSPSRLRARATHDAAPRAPRPAHHARGGGAVRAHIRARAARTRAFTASPSKHRPIAWKAPARVKRGRRAGRSVRALPPRRAGWKRRPMPHAARLKPSPRGCRASPVRCGGRFRQGEKSLAADCQPHTGRCVWAPAKRRLP